jgi:streptogramin lyase
MKNAIVSALAVIAVAGCESSAGPSQSAMLGYQVDNERNRSIWLTREGVQLHSAAAPTKLIPLPGWTYAAAPYCPPGVTVGPKGEIVVTSNAISTLWRIDPETSAVTVHELALDSDQDKDVGFAAVVYAPDQRAYIAYSETQRSTWKIDASLTGASKLAAADTKAQSRRNACAIH